MFLTDRQIKELGENVIITGYDQSNVGPVSYDVSIDYILAPEGNVESYDLPPQETVFIRTAEEIRVPENLLISIGDKNSLLRLGLTVDGPKYFPGHQTYMFLRVENVAAHGIHLTKNMKIAQLFYEQLDGTPDTLYGADPKSSFQSENEYRMFGNYSEEYQSRIRKIEKAEQRLEDTETRIYGNILTLMGIFVSVFSLIFVNMDFISSANFSLGALIKVDLTLGILLTLFLGLILVFFNKLEIKRFKLLMTILLCVFVVLMILILVPAVRTSIF